MTVSLRSIVVGLALAGAVQMGAASAALNGETKALLEEAQQFISKNEMKAAIIQLKNAVRLQPKEPVLRIELARAYLTTGDALGAEKELENALENGADPALLQLDLARTYNLLNRFEDVLGKTSIEITSKGQKAALLVQKAIAALELKKLPAAEKFAEQAVAEKPAFAQASEMLASAHLLQEKHDKAIKAIDDYIAGNGKTPRLLLIRGEVERAQGRLEAAMGYYSQALELNPDDQGSLFQRALVGVSMDRDELARADADRMLALYPDDVRATYLDALLVFRSGDADRADEILSQRGDSQLQFAPAIFLYSNVKLSQGELNHAQEYNRRYLALYPDSPEALALKASIHVRRGELLRAQDVLESAREIAPANIRVLSLLGKVYLMGGQADQAREVFKAASAIDPENADIKTQAAISNLSLDGASEAQEQLEQLVKTGRQVNEAGFALVASYVQARDYEEALAAADQLVESNPGDPLPYYIRADVLRLLERDAEAIDAFEAVAEKFPDFVPVRLSLATLAMVDGRVADGEAILRTLLKAKPDLGAAMVIMARIYEIRADDVTALDWYEKAIRSEPGEPKYHRDRISFLIRAKRLDDALARAQEYAGLFPETADAFQAQVQVLMALGRPKQAAEVMRKFVALEPRNIAAHMQYAQVLTAAKDFSGVEDALNKVLEMDPGHQDARLGLSELKLKTDGVDAAIDVLETAGGGINERALQIRKADYLYQSGKVTAAIAYYRELLNEAPDATVVMRYFAAVARDDRQEEAFAWLKDWVAANPSDIDSKMLLADNLLAVGNYGQAEEYYLELTKHTPNNAMPWNNLGWIYSITEHGKALDYAKRAYELAPKSAPVADTYAWILFKQGRVEEGFEILQKAIVQAPDNPELAYHYAAVLNAMGRKDEAARHLSKALGSNIGFAERGDAVALLEKLTSQ
ncbi:XrtA/PEP-CTERM system TPR-repeat protein PrsT [Aestuariispira insulae]|uniref:Putative PEP-CTERM system TPR-repeat lipoprotein n=1 Tax=Aestuariispira insulae TaxID=1461337 RepID=A0A3D9HK44_9PROT|nr:XrtA/PEP-CTERM system TPR-repeat protein PrsT [Aestuariispira insulae]RED49877.1 putative PEP-CTERM system TPR-repeat lipoprotein [Aestuariispira insulae]